MAAEAAPTAEAAAIAKPLGEAMDLASVSALALAGTPSRLFVPHLCRAAQHGEGEQY